MYKNYSGMNKEQNKLTTLLPFSADIVDSIFRYSSDELIVTDENFNILLQNYKINLKEMKDVFNFLDFLKKIVDFKIFKKISHLKKTQYNYLSLSLSSDNSLLKNPIVIVISKIFDKTNILKGFFISLKDKRRETIANVQKEYFISTLTHDLKIPVLAQINALKILFKQRQYSDDELLTEVFHSCLFLDRVIENLSAKFKNNFNSPLISGIYCDFSDIIRSSVGELDYLLKQKCLKVEFHILSEHLNQISAIPKEMYLLVDNLLINSINNSRQEGIITITLENDNDGIKLIICDCGFGINSDELNSIFDEYNNCADKYQQLAHILSLQICKQIIDAYGGTLDIKSETEKGMRVEVKLPSLFFIPKILTI